jgi:hypothetical protein
MDTLDALLLLAASMMIIFLIALKIGRRNTRKLSSATTSEDVAEIKPLNTRSIKEFHKRDFQFLEDGASENIFVYSKIALIIPVTVRIVVQNGGALLFYGTASEDIVVNPGGSAVIYGTVVGDVLNNGGELHVYGRIIGSLARNAGHTEVYSTAQILNEQLPA